MSKRINVNPGQYKVAGRERPGEDIVHRDEREELALGRKRAQRRSPRIPNQERPSPPPLKRRRTKSS